MLQLVGSLWTGNVLCIAGQHRDCTSAHFTAMARTLTAVMNFGIVITAAFHCSLSGCRLEEESHCFYGRGVVAGAETPPVTTSE